MKKLAAYLFAALYGAVLTLSATPPDPSWFTNCREAKAEAQKNNLPMFLFFTGSDWCPWCKRLMAETLNTARFRNFVKGKFVLVYLDFPQKNMLPEAVEWRNGKLRAHYEVEGFPTVIITEPDGRKIAELGYEKTDQFLSQLQRVLDFRKTRIARAATGAETMPCELNDFAEARKLAAEKGLPIIALFTRSDWSEACMLLKQKTLDTKEFRDFIDGNAVFLQLDFPRKVKLPEALAKQNETLAARYGVSVFPTTVVMNVEGEALGRIEGFVPVDEYVKSLKSLTKK